MACTLTFFRDIVEVNFFLKGFAKKTDVETGKRKNRVQVTWQLWLTSGPVPHLKHLWVLLIL